VAEKSLALLRFTLANEFEIKVFGLKVVSREGGFGRWGKYFDEVAFGNGR